MYRLIDIVIISEKDKYVHFALIKVYLLGTYTATLVLLCNYVNILNSTTTTTVLVTWCQVRTTLLGML